MAYTVATTKPCHYCGCPTNRRRDKLRVPMCGACGEQRMLEVAMARCAEHTEARRLWLIGQVAWADRGGIETCDNGELWRVRMRRHIERCRAELEDWVPSPSPN